MGVFLDTGYILALYNHKDIRHQQALEISNIIKTGEYGTAFISTYIFDELTTLALTRQSHAKAVEIGNMLLNSEIIMLNISENIFAEVWRLFQDRKNLSFTDCTNIKLMLENNIKNLATFDREFLQFKEINVLM